jgi:trehalose 6-phosphate phosphatase
MAETGKEARPPLLLASAALYLDFDGTLAAYASHPDGVTVDESLPRLLARLRVHLAGAVALVTGRSLAVLDSIVGLPDFAGAGLHGLEIRLPTGQVVLMGDPAAARPFVQALRERFGDDPCLVIEDKGATVALHYRRARGRAEECIAAMREIAETPDFVVQVGHAVVEARPRGIDKGGALRALAAHPPFAGRRPVFAGDDVTDEDGFRAAEAAGGYGVKVGLGPSAARYRIDGVAGVHDWLRESLDAIERSVPA